MNFTAPWKMSEHHATRLAVPTAVHTWCANLGVRSSRPQCAGRYASKIDSCWLGSVAIAAEPVDREAQYLARNLRQWGMPTGSAACLVAPQYHPPCCSGSASMLQIGCGLPGVRRVRTRWQVSGVSGPGAGLIQQAAAAAGSEDIPGSPQLRLETCLKHRACRIDSTTLVHTQCCAATATSFIVCLAPTLEHWYCECTQLAVTSCHCSFFPQSWRTSYCILDVSRAQQPGT